MSFQRRRILQLLSFSFGSTLLPSRSTLAFPAQTPAPQSDPSTAPTEKVTGIGGFFFRAKDPKALALWYQQNLGISPIPKSYDQLGWLQEAGPTAFAPFKETTDYFGDPSKMFMLNFRVRDLDKMAAQLQAAGIPVKIDPQTYPNGRFARIHDPEGNPIELWQPMSPAH